MENYQIITEMEEIKRFDEFYNNDSIIFCCEEEYYLPKFKDEGSAGYDIGVKREYETNILYNYSFGKFKTGVKIKTTPNYKVFLLPRGSMFEKMGGILVNSPGLIDSSYRGEIFAPIYFVKANAESRSSWNPFILKCVDNNKNRIDFFQLVISINITHESHNMAEIWGKPKICGIVNKKVYDNFDVLFPSKRGDGCFGSTDNLL